MIFNLRFSSAFQDSSQYSVVWKVSNRPPNSNSSSRLFQVYWKRPKWNNYNWCYHNFYIQQLSMFPGKVQVLITLSVFFEFSLFFGETVKSTMDQVLGFILFYHLLYFSLLSLGLVFSQGLGDIFVSQKCQNSLCITAFQADSLVFLYTATWKI